MFAALRSPAAGLLLIAFTLVAACDNSRQRRADDDPGAGTAKSAEETTTTAESQKPLNWAPENMGAIPIGEYRNYTETGDLAAIKKRGVFRVLVDPSRTAALPRAAAQQDIEIAQAKRIAEQLGLEPVILLVDNFSELIPQLNAGKGDLIGNNLLITEERRQQVQFSIPTAETRLALASGLKTPEVKEGDSLKGKTLAVTRGTLFAQKAEDFARQHPGVKIQLTDQNYVDILVDVAMGKTDFSIVDELALDLVLQFRDDLKTNRTLPDTFDLAWAMRGNSPELLRVVDEQVRHLRMTSTTQRFTGDLDAIRERGVLRAVTRNHPGTYFMWKGQILGYEFSLLEKYADKIDVRLEVIVAESHEDFVRMLQQGEADISASLLAITERRKRKGMAFSDPYIDAQTGIVARKGDRLQNLSDLDGRTIYVRRASSQYDAAQRLSTQVPGVKIELAPDELDIQQIIDRVADGEYDLTIADDVSVKLEQAWRDDILLALPLPQEQNRYAWMLRDSNPKLLKSVNAFFAKPKVNEKLTSLYARYFEHPIHTRPEITALNHKGQISPFDELVQQYTEESYLDWRLVVAQMFQESGFDPKAESWVGAQGLMQVMPNTGKQVGETDLFDPETSVRAGIKYLEWLHGKFTDKGKSPEDAMWFTLAAYNAGLGHVYDAQDLAESKGWDRGIWFGNVENAMLLLSKPEYYKKARYGYARGQEPFDYVRKIEARFRSFVSLLEAAERERQAGMQPATDRELITARTGTGDGD